MRRGELMATRLTLAAWKYRRPGNVYMMHRADIIPSKIDDLGKQKAKSNKQLPERAFKRYNQECTSSPPTQPIHICTRPKGLPSENAQMSALIERKNSSAMHNEPPFRMFLGTIRTLDHLALTRAWSRPFWLPLSRCRATCPPLRFLPLMLFHPHSTSRLLVFALIFFPKGFRFEFMPVAF